MSNILHRSLETLLRELIEGPDASAAWMLNDGDVGLLRSLDKLTASAASAAPVAGGATIAAHVDHVRYGLSLMNRWSQGEQDPWSTADWAASWNCSVVKDHEWAELRRALGTEARAWLETLRAPRDYSENELNGVIVSVAISHIILAPFVRSTARSADRSRLDALAATGVTERLR